MILFKKDADDLIVTFNNDGGDSFARTMMYYYGMSLTSYARTSDFCNALNKFRLGTKFRRYPYAPYNDPSDFSRDQARPGVIACGQFGVASLPPFFGRYPNGDISSLTELGEAIRARNCRWLWVLLWVCDLWTLLSMLVIIFIKAREPGKLQRWLGAHVHWIFVQGEANNANGVPQDVYGADNVGTDLNMTLNLLQSQRVLPTPISHITRKLYKRYRPGGIQYAWDHYFRGDNPFNVLYSGLISSM